MVAPVDQLFLVGGEPDIELIFLRCSLSQGSLPVKFSHNETMLIRESGFLLPSLFPLFLHFVRPNWLRTENPVVKSNPTQKRDASVPNVPLF